MKVSLKWLADYVDLKLSTEELARRLTLSTAEVEGIERIGADWQHVSVGEVLAVERHPNADRLRLATVNAGEGPKTVVCGAPNLAAGQRIAFGEVGARLIDGHTGKPAVLKANTIRGVESAGMVLSERELGLSDEHEGILVLPENAPVGMPLREYLGDAVLDLYSWPHRPDLMAMIGVARELAALTQQPLREPALDYPVQAGPVEGRLSVEIDAPELCLRYTAALVEGVQIGPSPAWMQERLTAAGLRPINNVVDITNYVMLEYGQPLHAFDYDRIHEHRIIVRRARAGERLLTLDGVMRNLDERMLLIADPTGPVALAGVMGGADSDVQAGTTRILLEAANFNGMNIRGTSTRLQLRSEASARFEKSIGPEVALPAARRAVQLLVELGGGRAAEGIVDAYPGRRPPLTVSLSEQRLRTVLGIEVAPNLVRQALGSLGFSVEGGPPEPYRVGVPPWRTDVRVADDLVEEVVRIVGYDAIPQTRIAGRIPEAEPQPLRDLRLRLQDLFVGAGLHEVITYSLISEELFAKTGGERTQPLRIVQPASSEHVILRLDLRGSLLQTAAANARQRRPLIQIFEIARVYGPRAGDLPDEQELAVAVLTGRHAGRWGMPGGEAVDFYDAKGVVEAVLDRLGLRAGYRAAEDPDLLSGRTAEIVAGETVIGVVGQVHPEVAARFELVDEVFLLELRLEAILPHLGRARGYTAVSRYPAVRQDFALLVDASVTAEEVRIVIAGGRHVVEARPFDVFTGGNVPHGQKSLTFAVTYQAMDHTLTDAEVAQSQSRLLNQLGHQLGARLREG